MAPRFRIKRGPRIHEHDLEREPTLPEFQRMVLRSLSEAQFQQQAVLAAQLRGWWVYAPPKNARKCYRCGNVIKTPSNPGWPDLFLLHAERQKVLVIELKKKDGGRLSDEQKAVHARFAACGLPVITLYTTEWDRLIQLLEES